MQLDEAVVRPSVEARKTTALKGLLWVVVLAATFLAVGAILFLVYAPLEAGARRGARKGPLMVGCP